jgi:hypothetical protein
VKGSCEHDNESTGSINAGKLLKSCTTGGFTRRAQLREVSLTVVIIPAHFTIFS